MPTSAVDAVRSFNRFYTRYIGLLDETLLSSAYSLTEIRVMYELSLRSAATATAIAAELGLDAGYLSRLLRSFERQGLIQKRKSETDGRATLLSLSEKGRAVFAQLDERSDKQVAAMLAKMPGFDQARLLEAMGTIQRLLATRPADEPLYTLRQPRVGDMGWVVESHGEAYAAEQGWNEDFEALIAEIVAKFIRGFDPERERAWIAERDGVRIGSIFLVKSTERVAKLRLLLVDSRTRGFGLGRRLIAECVEFARGAGYEKIVLWTDSDLAPARHLYECAGFRLVSQEPVFIGGKHWTGEEWELQLTRPTDESCSA